MNNTPPVHEKEHTLQLSTNIFGALLTCPKPEEGVDIGATVEHLMDSIGTEYNPDTDESTLRSELAKAHYPEDAITMILHHIKIQTIVKR